MFVVRRATELNVTICNTYFYVLMGFDGMSMAQCNLGDLLLTGGAHLRMRVYVCKTRMSARPGPDKRG